MRNRPEPIPFNKHPISKIQRKQPFKKRPQCAAVINDNKSETDDDSRTIAHQEAEEKTVKKLKRLFTHFKANPNDEQLNSSQIVSSMSL